MRATFLVFAALLASAARGEAKLPGGADACVDCHNGKDAPAVNTTAFGASVHADKASCTDCHAGYAMGPHDSELPALAPAEQALVARLAKARWPEAAKVKEPKAEKGEAKETRVTAPRAYLACAGCHEMEHPEAMAGWQRSAHSRWLREDTAAPGPTCASCHGPIHALRKLAPYDPKATARAKVPEDRREIAKRCEACHGNEEFAKTAGVNPEAAITYHDSMHGRLARVGNPYAPTCTSCHAAKKEQGGTHAIVAKTNPASAVSAGSRQETCGRCHEGTNASFAALVAHKPIQEIGSHVVPHVVHVAFSWLTTLTLLFFAFHVSVDFIFELRQRLARKTHGESPDAARSVVRFDIHQRAQHWLMLSGVILLGVTGWPLRGAGDLDAAGYSKAFMRIFGGAEGAAIWHRVGAVLIICSAIYHLFYLTFLAAKKRLPFSMLPVPKDAIDMKDNILFMLGVRKERPKFERYMYLEKFDYWAVFWGIVMMVGTGFVFWFPTFFASWAPSWVITAALIIHGEEATLAILFLFVVHFYNVHLKPSIFPMNWTWLNGRITVENLKHEHPLEYERLKPTLKD
jgi:cytochrome b subunit of formate dehydrogenase/nitrate/TMAO reductase-like tetraheme cytochrome c subunit